MDERPLLLPGQPKKTKKIAKKVKNKSPKGRTPRVKKNLKEPYVWLLKQLKDNSDPELNMQRSSALLENTLNVLEAKDVVIRNVLAFHRRNGSQVFGDLHRRFFLSPEPNPKIPSQKNMDPLLFNCVSEFVAYMNSPDKKYHHFNRALVLEKLEKYIIYYFKEWGSPFNPKMHMPRAEQHLNISGYAVTGIVSLFSNFDFSLEKYFKPEVFGKLLQTFEFVAWNHFAAPSLLSKVSGHEA